MNEQPRYILYVRKSSESEDKQMASIDDQLAEMRRVAENLGLVIVETITESKSAKQPGRQGFNTMIQKIMNGEADAILCWKLNRLARNPVDGGQISWLLQQSTIKHIQTYSREYRPSDNVLMMQVEFGMANQFIVDLSSDTRRGMRQKAERGWYPASTLPPGYAHNHSKRRPGDGPDIICDEQFPIVESLWQKFLSGQYTMTEIYEEGCKLGLKNTNGKPYARSAYNRFFTNEFFCGYFYWKDIKGNQVKHKGKHKAVVSEDDFNRVQKLLGKYGKPTRVISYNYPLKGMHCGECGCSVTAEHKHQAICTGCKHKFSIKSRTSCPLCGLDISEMNHPSIIDKVYYHCTKRRGKCAQKGINSEELEEKILKVLASFSLSERFYEWACEALRYLHENETGYQQNELVALKKRESELLGRLDRLVVMRADGEITASDLNRFREETDIALSEVRKELAQVHERAVDWVGIANEYLEFAKMVKERFENGTDHEKREILNFLGSNLALKDKKLEFSMPHPLRVFKSTWDAIKDEKEWFERKKAFENKGSFTEKRVPISIGLPGQDSNLRPID